MRSMRLCTSGKRVCGKKSTKEEWLEYGDRCPYCGGYSFVVVSEADADDWDEFEENQNPIEEDSVEEVVETPKPSLARPILLIVLSVVLALFLFWAMNKIQIPEPTTSVPTVDVVQQPQTSAMDIKSVSTIGTEQVMMIIFVAIIFLTGWLDRKQSNQPGDAYVAILGVVIILLCGTNVATQLFHILKADAYATIVVSLVCLAVVVAVSLAGTPDLTPVGLFFGVLGLGGGVLFNNLGSVQVMFHIQSAPLLTGASLFSYISTKQMDGAWFSVLVYACLILAFLAILFEMLKASAGDGRWLGFFIATLGIVAYICGRNFIPSTSTWNNPYVLLLAIGALNFIVASLSREKLDAQGINYTQYKLGLLKLVTPWDVILFQALLGGFLIIITGKV